MDGEERSAWSHEERLSAANAEEAKVASVRYQLNNADEKNPRINDGECAIIVRKVSISPHHMNKLLRAYGGCLGAKCR